MNKWQLTDEVKVKFMPIVQNYINKIEAEEFEGEELILTDTELNPYMLWKLLEELGYKKTEFEDNGWQMDFWITFTKQGFQTLTIAGTGITFELNLLVRE